ncbi:bifunctional metallophosphatase/5'-nucleotidase [bacterium]|nr:bifunctional metallophosphatase/5'-nucleotidase [bacterium]
MLYTNDVHCGIEKKDKTERLGYSSLAAYKKKCLKETPYVTMVDSGDAIQGETIGTLSKGQYLVDIMNAVGYDFCILGNHEFDYGMDQLVKLIKQSKAKYLGCNLVYTGPGKDELLPLLKPYAIVKYSQARSKGVKVGYIGVSTPESLTKSAPTTFQKDDKFVYSFNGENPEKFYSCIQSYIDKCRKDGADYVVLLTHLGDSSESIPYTSVDLIEHTRGVDVVLDGHAHSTIPCRKVKNVDGRDTILTSTGTKLCAIGRMVIGTDGNITTELITKEDDKDAAVEKTIAGIKKNYEASVNAVVAHSSVAVSDKDENGCRLVRNRETAIGDLSSDAYRYAAKSDIGIVNGGGIRAGLPKGDITFDNVIAVNPYGNTLACCEATGQDILDALEHAYRAVEAKASDGKNSIGECGGFLSVSGLKCTIDTSIPSHVVLDENGMFVKVDGERRVKDVQVLNSKGEYVPIDPKATYTVASQNYTLKQCGDGFTMFAKKNYPIGEGECDYQMLINYIEHLNGDLSDYVKPQGRITIK